MPIYREVFNEHYFSSVDTEDKAYWLGFLYADGCISVRYNNNSNRTAYPRLTFLGTMKFLSVLRSILNVDYAIVNISKIWAMEIGSAINFNKVVRYMYDNSNIFLNRKKVMAYSYL